MWSRPVPRRPFDQRACPDQRIDVTRMIAPIAIDASPISSETPSPLVLCSKPFAFMLRHRLEFLAFRLAVCLIDCLSPRTAARWADRLAAILCDWLPARWTRTDVVHDNLRKAFGPQLTEAELRRLRHGMWTHLFRTVIEMVQAPRKLHLHSYRRIVEFDGLAETNNALLSGRRVLLLGGHFGSWEICTTLFGLWGFRVGIVAREMDNPYLHDWFWRERQAAGHRLLAKKGDFDEMLALLERGGNVGLLCDQDAGSRGLFVDFFGTPASTFKSIALLALEYDAILIVGSTIRLPDDFDRTGWSRFRMQMEAVIDPRQITSKDPVREITQRFTAALERSVRRAPEQYFWLHRRWKSEPRKRPARAA
jgi:KDO2-lipid IV(A) lauroyltransferase